MSDDTKGQKKIRRFTSTVSWLTKQQIDYAEQMPYSTIIHYLTNFLTNKEENEFELKMLDNPLLKEKVEGVRKIMKDGKITTLEDFIKKTGIKIDTHSI